jgi:hypothetical protein
MRLHVGGGLGGWVSWCHLPAGLPQAGNADTTSATHGAAGKPVLWLLRSAASACDRRQVMAVAPGAGTGTCTMGTGPCWAAGQTG